MYIDKVSILLKQENVLKTVSEETGNQHLFLETLFLTMLKQLSLYHHSNQ